MAVERILVNGVTEILKKLLPVISQQVSQAWGVKDDLRKLGRTLESIQALISDAEEKQITDATVRLWLRRLKDLVYDADDVMDEFCYETMRRRERGSHLTNKFHDFIHKSSNLLVFHSKMAGKIRALNKRLDEIFNDRVRYSLNDTSGSSQVNQITKQPNRITTSVVDDSVLIGREDARLDIVKMLTNISLSSSSPSSSSSSSSTSLHNSSSQQLPVVSIVGMGGLGKTSLAQLVYKDESIKSHFEPRIWVCISNNFDVYRILKEIIESVTDGSFGDVSNVDVLARQVKEKLIGKRYLLVLDDLWNEDAGDWENLKGALVNGVEGSKLLVTTRSQTVASVIGGKVHNLQKLSDAVCWSIIQKKVSFPLSQNMITIGRDIAMKCDGLPLAANFLGNLLNSKRDWVSINDDKSLWDSPAIMKVISILKLSYDNLPSPLKQCFSYCCLFPKDWVIQRNTLIRLWLAEGFLQISNEVNNRSLEDVGNDYFEFLLWNSFFQDTKEDKHGVIISCKMHDLVHDLAMSVADRNEYQIHDGKEDVSQVRRLQLICDKGSSATTHEMLCKAKNLRTIFVLNPERRHLQVGNFSAANRLRVLCPLGLWHEESSFSISKFKHLRFLDLSKCEFDLPHDVALNQFHNLQTLILFRCSNVDGFLGGIGRLENLRHLDVSKSYIKVFNDDHILNFTNLMTLDLSDCRGLEALPENIGLLKHLMTLSFKGCLRLCALPIELGALTRLRCLDLRDTKIKLLPESCISNLFNLETVDFGETCELPKEIKNWPKLEHFKHRRSRDSMPRGMEKLTCLKTLDSYSIREEAADTGVCGSGIEQLADLNSLEVLVIKGLPNMKGGIEDAKKAKLKDKTNLRKLHLDWGSCGRDENHGMVLEGLRPHPNLRELFVAGFSGLNLPRWMGCLLPNLVKLNLRLCSKCENLPALGMLPCLRDLRIQSMWSLKCLVREFDSPATALSLFPSLVKLRMENMYNLEEWVAAPPPSSYNFYVNSFPLLEELDMENCPELRSAPNSLPCLKELKLIWTNGKAVNSILSASGRRGCLTSLTSITIRCSPGLINFPLGTLLRNNTPNLHSLMISNCSEFQGFFDEDNDDLNNKNNSSNSSLHTLELKDCPVLTSLPDLRLWNSSLRVLTIFGCPKLNKESIPYDLKTSLNFLKSLKVDFLQREENPTCFVFNLLNLMEK